MTGGTPVPYSVQEISREFNNLKQDMDRKHVRLEKLLNATAKQTAGATVQALQQQLRTMQQEIIASLRSGHVTDVSQIHMSSDGTKDSGPHMAIGFQDDIDLHTARTDTDENDAFDDDGFGDSDDEDWQRRVAENSQLRKAAAQRKSRKTRGSKKRKDSSKEAWGSDDEGSKDEQPKKRGSIMGGAKEAAGIQEALAIRTKRELVTEEDHMAPGRIYARKIVFHPRFELVVSAVLTLCAVLIGAEVHWGMHELGQEQLPFFRAMDILFNIIFTLELILRVVADYWFFISRFNPSLSWNILDMVLVCIALVEEFASAAQRGNVTMAETGVLRMIRMLRLVRVVRLFRVIRFFSDLRIMVNSIKVSARALIWALLLMLLVIYMFGVTFMQLCREHLNENPDAVPELVTKFQSLYGGLGRTIMTLFMTITGGILWRDAVEPLEQIHWVLEPIFASYVFFTVFCTFNIITGIFVDNAQISKRTDESVIRRDWIRERRRWIVDVAELYSKVMVNRNAGELSREDFEKTISQDKVQTLFRKLGVSAEGYTVGELWELFDQEDKGTIIQADFAQGIRQFQGAARSIDIAKIKKDTKEMDRKLNYILKSINGYLPDM